MGPPLNFQGGQSGLRGVERDQYQALENYVKRQRKRLQAPKGEAAN
jgi:hypothetical protein